MRRVFTNNLHRAETLVDWNLDNQAGFIIQQSHYHKEFNLGNRREITYPSTAP
jgi:hypothetical protein